MADREQIRAALTGPVPTIRTPFSTNGDIDLAGLGRIVDHLVGVGCKAIILTYGDSLFSLLSDAEIATVTRKVIETTNGRATVVAADGQWSTPQTLEFARAARELGADLLMVLPPSWRGSVTVDSLVEHYESITAEIPVMVVTNLFSGPANELGVQTLAKAVERVDGIWALKEDVGGEFARRVCSQVADRWAVIAANEESYMDLQRLGAVGYMTPFLYFQPDEVWRTWRAMQQQDWAAVRKFLADFNHPYREFVNRLPGSYNAGIMGVCELVGLCGRWRRKPYHSLSGSELAALREFLAAKSWLPPPGIRDVAAGRKAPNLPAEEDVVRPGQKRLTLYRTDPGARSS